MTIAVSGTGNRTRSPGDGRRRDAILVVEDDQALRQLLGRVVELLGFEAVLAADGAEAAAAFIAAGGDFTCVFLDAMMPVMGGPEALGLMRAAHPGTPVVCISGHNRLELEPLFGGCQPDLYLAKPCEVADLRGAIEALGGRQVEFARA